MRLPKPKCLGLTAWAGALLILPACSSDGNFTFLGYTTAPNYDCNIRTVHVPIMQNRSFRRGLEFDFTRVLIREIESKTPFKTVSSPVGADTELLCTIVNTNKAVINFNQIGEVREGEITVAVEVLWRDLRPGHAGEFLSGMGKPDRSLPGLPDVAPAGGPPGSKASSPPGPHPVLITPSATFIPELGGSRTSAEWRIANNLAVQIVSMMETWGPPRPR
jgi:hypothetical protein